MTRKRKTSVALTDEALAALKRLGDGLSVSETIERLALGKLGGGGDRMTKREHFALELLSRWDVTELTQHPSNPWDLADRILAADAGVV